MKNLFFIILITWIISTSCQVPRDIQLYYVKIAPTGISDFPRDTLYISLKKIDSITNFNSTQSADFISKIITNEKTLSRIISFIKENDYNKGSENKNFNEYGCFNVSLYDRDLLIKSYKLDRLESKKYLNNLINALSDNNLDINVIKKLKEKCLAPIDY